VRPAHLYGAAHRRSAHLFSAPSACLQRGLNTGGDTYSNRMTNKGGSVVHPRPITTRGGSGAAPRGVDGSIESGGRCSRTIVAGLTPAVERQDCVAIMKTPET
jgi:hypothetical protein